MYIMIPNLVSCYRVKHILLYSNKAIIEIIYIFRLITNSLSIFMIPLLVSYILYHNWLRIYLNITLISYITKIGNVIYIYSEFRIFLCLGSLTNSFMYPMIPNLVSLYRVYLLFLLKHFNYWNNIYSNR
mgnify:CR=1 FL=1